MPLQIIRQNMENMQVDAIIEVADEEQWMPKITKGCNAKYRIQMGVACGQDALSDENGFLQAFYTASLKLAVENGCNSVACPVLSFGHPKEKNLSLAVRAIADFLFDHELMVYLCVFGAASYKSSPILFEEIHAFIGDDYIEKCDADSLDGCDACNLNEEYRIKNYAPMCAPMIAASNESLFAYMKDMDKSFAYKLFDRIDERGMTDVECYKKANVDKKTFSKIKCNPDTYRPSKQTAVAFAIALKLNLDETQELLGSAGMTLSESFIFDKIIRYFIQKGNYDIFEINEALFAFDQVLLGSF